MAENALEHKLSQHHETVVAFLKDLGEVFDAMDAEYNRVANQYGFECKGCEDNCCLTRFYHHTVLEYAYLNSGFDALETEKKHKILKKAAEVNLAYERGDTKKQSLRVMCPLNSDEMCDLYAHRPMICRLHGIPHELQLPNGRKTMGPGCGAFDMRCRTSSYIPFDRTPFYVQISNMEQRVRTAIGFSEKIKMTVAEMLVS